MPDRRFLDPYQPGTSGELRNRSTCGLFESVTTLQVVVGSWTRHAVRVLPARCWAPERAGRRFRA